MTEQMASKRGTATYLNSSYLITQLSTFFGRKCNFWGSFHPRKILSCFSFAHSIILGVYWYHALNSLTLSSDWRIALNVQEFRCLIHILNFLHFSLFYQSIFSSLRQRTTAAVIRNSPASILVISIYWLIKDNISGCL